MRVTINLAYQFYQQQNMREHRLHVYARSSKRCSVASAFQYLLYLLEQHCTAMRLTAQSWQVTGYDPIVTAEAAQEFNVEKRELDDIWADADYITVHTPLIPQTKRKCRVGEQTCSVHNSCQ